MIDLEFLLCLNSSVILKSVYKQEKECGRKSHMHLEILFTSFLKAKFLGLFIFFILQRCVMGNRFVLFPVIIPRSFTALGVTMN